MVKRIAHGPVWNSPIDYALFARAFERQSRRLAGERLRDFGRYPTHTTRE
jgi:hypothetical protein